VLRAARAALALALVALSATRAESAPADPWPELEMRELSPREWLRRVQEKLSQKYQVDAAELHFGPAPPRYAAFVRGPPPATGKKKTRRPRRWSTWPDRSGASSGC
jgi:hypothetical protein